MLGGKNRDFKKLLHKCLEDVLSCIKNQSQSGSIDEIFKRLGGILNSAGIGIVVTIINSQKNEIYFRYASTSFGIIDRALMKWKNISLIGLNEYSEVLKSVKPLFCSDRFEKLFERSRLSAILEARLIPRGINSIILPLIIKNEAIGFFEFFSKDLQKRNIKIAGAFAQKLAVELSQIILYKEIIAAEKNFKKLSELNQIILDNAPVSIITIDCFGNITSANKYFYKFSGSKFLIKKNIFQTSFFAREGLENDYKKLLRTGQTVKKDDCYTKNFKNEVKYLNITAIPMRNKAGKIIGAISMAIDNTKAYQAKQALERLNQQLERKVSERTEQLDVMNRKLKKALELKSKFIADASHELRTPLTIIQGNLDLRIKELLLENKEIPEVVGMIDKEIKHMSGIITDLTALTNADQKNTPAIYEKVNLNEVVEDVALSLEILAKKKNIKLIMENGDEAREIMGDEIMLEKLFLNIVNNAIKYNNAGGWVKISMEKIDQKIKITVADNGIGIPEKDMPFIFERFFRTSKSRSGEESGSGLGLAICKWIVEDHRGKIDVSSKEDQGSCFTISLPIDYKKREQAH